MITNYIPNTCKYNVNNLKKVVHIFSEASNKVYIDNGEAYVTGTVYDFQTISATSVSYNETTSYDDRFKFQKTVTATVDGFVKLSALNEKYYVVLEDENGILWLVNQDFPSLVTYTYTLEDGKDDTVFTFNALSNFPTLKLNATIGNFNECKSYSLVKVENLKILEKRYANIDASSSIIYGYSNQVYKAVKFNEGSLSVEEVFDGTNVNTSIQFNINMDDYQSSWHYNVLEYPYNKYVVVIDHLACGFEMGLVPSFNAQGSEIDGSNDTVTITLVGGSQKGSEWANSWTEVTVAPVYEWRLSNEWQCTPMRWVDVGYECSGATGYDKYLVQKEQKWDYDADDWTDVIPIVSAATLVERSSEYCGYAAMKYILTLSDSTAAVADCDDTSAITQNEVSAYTGTVVSAEIGNCVTTIADRGFQNCQYLTTIDLSNNLTAIGAFGFMGCYSLSSMTIPNGVTYIGQGAFSACINLESVNIPSGITNINQYTFSACYKLESIDIPSGVTEIGQQAFQHCSSLTSVTIPNSVTTIVDGAFLDCSGLTSITIPDTVTSIGASTFSGCSSVVSIDLGHGIDTINYQCFKGCSHLTGITIPNGVTSIGDYAFNDCGSLGSVSIPNTVTSIGYGAFMRAGGGNVTIPDSVTSIGEKAFWGCSYTLGSVSIGNGVTTIGRDAFAYCYVLNNVTIGTGITEIGYGAFYNTGRALSLTINATTPPALGANAFEGGTSSHLTIYVPSASVEAYKTAWSGYASKIQAIP